MLRIVTNSATETRELARSLAEFLQPNDRIGLIGELGMGKTVFVQGLAEGLGISEPITSPTFVLIKSYTGRLTLHHCDWYRLNSIDDVWSSGFEDLEYDPGVIIVEWADRFASALQDPYLKIRFRSEGEDTRRITMKVSGRSPHLTSALNKLSAVCHSEHA